MIDLRSDTLTVPTAEMREFISKAPVGDDVFGEDPTVNELQDYIAELLKKEAAIYVPSGVMANQLAIATQTKPGDEVIVEADSHIFYYETAAPSVISRVQLNCIKSDYGEMNLGEIERAIRPDIYYFPKTSLICIENTHNRHGGTIISLDYIKSLRELSSSYNIALHCDGARIWNASIATGIEPKTYAEYFDTISVCLSKGLGAPVGSLLVGEKSTIEMARKWRKILGGGMRQAGIIAAGGLFAIKNNLNLIEYSHQLAKEFALNLSKSELIEIDLNKVQTNIVMFEIPSYIDDKSFINECLRNGINLIPFGNNKIRAVFHFQISKEDAIYAAEKIKFVLEYMVINNG